MLTEQLAENPCSDVAEVGSMEAVLSFLVVHSVSNIKMGNIQSKLTVLDRSVIRYN